MDFSNLHVHPRELVSHPVQHVGAILVWADIPKLLHPKAAALHLPLGRIGRWLKPGGKLFVHVFLASHCLGTMSYSTRVHLFDKGKSTGEFIPFSLLKGGELCQNVGNGKT